MVERERIQVLVIIKGYPLASALLLEKQMTFCNLSCVIAPFFRFPSLHFAQIRMSGGIENVDRELEKDSPLQDGRNSDVELGWEGYQDACALCVFGV